MTTESGERELEEDIEGMFDSGNRTGGDFDQLRFPDLEDGNFNVPAATEVGVLDQETPWHRWRRIMLSAGESELSLDGKTCVEIEIEASRIKLGATFSSFQEFQFAVDCYCCLNQRASKKAKTYRDFCLRTCTYGHKIRPLVGRTGKWAEDAVARSVRKENVNPDMEHRNFHQFTQRMPSQVSVEGGTDLNVVPDGDVFEVARRPRKQRKVPDAGACGQRARYVFNDQNAFSKDAEDELMEGHYEKGKNIYIEEVQEKPVRCEWRVRASRNEVTGIIKITVCNTVHTCPSYAHLWRGPNKKSLFLAKLMSNRVVLDSNTAIGKLVTGFQQTYRKQTEYQPCLRMRERVRDWIQGGTRRSFHAIPSLCRLIKQTDEDSVVDWDEWPISNIFRRVFVCPSASRYALAQAQKVVTLDACHTKNKKYPAQIFTASCLDGNNQSIILAFTVCNSEDKENWLWFCEHLCRSIDSIDGEDIVFISDRCKRLCGAVESVFSKQIHGHCCQHIRMNVRTRYGKEAEDVFWKAVYARKEQKFNLLLDDLQASGRKGAEAADYIRQIPPERWARWAFPRPRYGKVSSNLAESVNAALKPIRYFAPFRVVCEIWNYIMRIFDKRRELCGTYQTLTPFSKSRFEENERQAGKWICLSSNTESALIQTEGGKSQFVVRHGHNQSCDCLEFQEMQWPCSHSMCWDGRFGKDPMRRMNRIWYSRSCRTIYSRALPPLVTNDLMLGFTCGPPPEAVRKGRHRVVRIPNAGLQGKGVYEIEIPIDNDPMENSHPPQEATVKNASVRVMHPKKPIVPRFPNSRRCGVCKTLGHNKRTCPSRDFLNRSSSGEGASSHEVPNVTGSGERSLSQEADGGQMQLAPDHEEYTEISSDEVFDEGLDSHAESIFESFLYQHSEYDFQDQLSNDSILF